MGQALGCYQVDQSNVAIKEQFGKFKDVLEPGCHCLPWYLGYQIAGGLSLRVQQPDVKCETKTKDNVFVNVVASVQYRAVADKASDAFYKLTKTREQIQSYVFDVIRASVPKLELDVVFEQKNDIVKAVEDELEKAMSTYGYEIIQTLIVDIEPDVNVKRAMNEVNAAARMRLAANEKTEEKKPLEDSWKLFQRLRTDEDEMELLQGFLDYTSQRGSSYHNDTAQFYDQIKSKLQLDFNKNQLVEKIRRLKKKYGNVLNKISSGKEFVLKTAHDQATFDEEDHRFFPSFGGLRWPHLQLL